MSTFDTTDMSQALADKTNVGEEQQTDAKSAPTAEESAIRARLRGWVEPEGYNYATYNASTREEREAVDAGPDASPWASNAVKYEWKDDYGDVGPADPELEQLLFKAQTFTDAGELFER